MSSRGHRRWWRLRVLGLSACAAAMAGAVVVAPMVVGADRLPDPTSYLNRVEGGGFDHNRAHLRAGPAARQRAVVRAGLCDDGAWRAANPESCPAPPPSETATLSAMASGERVGALGPTQPDGLWGPLLSIPSTAIHAVVMPTGKVLYVSQPKYPTEQETDGGNAYVWDPATNTSRAVPPPVVPYGSGPDRPANLWCGGQATLADGRILFVGGNLAYPQNGGVGAGNGFRGAKWVMTFDPWTETWTRYADMPHGRWYPTLTELADGRVLIVGGWDETGGVEGPGGPTDAPTMVNDQDVEVFDPSVPAGGQATTVVSKLPPNGPGQPSPWPDHTNVGLYPHMFLLPSSTSAGHGGDKVLVAGPGKWDSAIIDTTTWRWVDVVDMPDTGQQRLSSDRAWGTAWLAPGGTGGGTEVVLLGGADTGAPAPGPGTASPPLATAEVLDLNNPDAGWRLDPSLALNHGRAHFNTVLLPDGTIFTNGGGYGRKNDTLYADPVYTAELYTPGSGWRDVGDEADARTYHSTAVLLPDGRVASAGDDRDIAPSHIPPAGRTAQIYSPPYLFDGPRPEVTAAPPSIGYGTPFRITVPGSPSSVARAVLIHPGAVTHANDMGQRVIGLDVTPGADAVTLSAPQDATVAPPGYYMLFVLNAQGVPSVATWVKVDPDAPAPATHPAPATPGVAPAPPGTPPVAARLRVNAARPAVRVRGHRVRVRLSLRSNRRAVARISLVRPAIGRAPARAVRTRSIALRAGVVTRPVLIVRRGLLGRATSLRVSIVVRGATGGRLVVSRLAELPARR